jgi:hypothetical protein
MPIARLPFYSEPERPKPDLSLIDKLVKSSEATLADLEAASPIKAGSVVKPFTDADNLARKQLAHNVIRSTDDDKIGVNFPPSLQREIDATPEAGCGLHDHLKTIANELRYFMEVDQGCEYLFSYGSRLIPVGCTHLLRGS